MKTLQVVPHTGLDTQQGIDQIPILTSITLDAELIPFPNRTLLPSFDTSSSAVDVPTPPPSLEKEVAELCGKYPPSEVLKVLAEMYPEVMSEYIQSRIDREVQLAVARALKEERSSMNARMEELRKEEEMRWREKIHELEEKMMMLDSSTMRTAAAAEVEESRARVVVVEERQEEEEVMEVGVMEIRRELETSEKRCSDLEKSLAEALEKLRAREEDYGKLLEAKMALEETMEKKLAEEREAGLEAMVGQTATEEEVAEMMEKKQREMDGKVWARAVIVYTCFMGVTSLKDE
ncbi:conserved hypothetical protein [Perkinsus marinus ATCC 50983]|uniref:Uncharacterized protein n=1 Tax=Perkinsus marinus (strain ATCC 50983 / TXsc) TaxID=423536 RepID=C5KL03_PERM5|nr:conserved hypothetical protein [Perkinsus marinus ATCC 50983]EER14811.1 conserved hypothetical protein [Perkinsus marinus ATCC 50983]|eukprot:XP_002783015.1 conserved hypothetical protein [Perkinsus marinus ATCC 50983]